MNRTFSLTFTYKQAVTETSTLSPLPILNRLAVWSTLNLFICQSVRVYASFLGLSSSTQTQSHTTESVSLRKQSRKLYHILNEAALQRYQIVLHLMGDGGCSCVRGSNKTNYFQGSCGALQHSLLTTKLKFKRKTQVHVSKVTPMPCGENIFTLFM